ncbi:P-loop containing nucleoside triphosphate hydrolase protein [Xylariaceae sp. FL0255]|nr:P-loop containing nucleoside triphosphate hydrolase protein [Xylariaceae sp. FL0255]
MGETINPPSPYDGRQLQTQNHRDLLDVIDTLRSQGIGRYVDLPQIIVCGDQSSGKSSVLEAISGLSFPTKDNLCTRFAMELILRRNPEVGLDIHIIPSHDRSEDEKKKLQAFRWRQETLDISQVVEAAKQAMGLDERKVFSTDTLRVEISGPNQPHLTMVDLPGLFLAGNKDQSEDDAALVEELVLSYMKKPRSIILAVVSAKSDFALQQVTRHARALDPQGIRIMGLITKPDTLDVGSDSERFYVELAQNKDVKFSLGWHVLRNRSYSTRDASTTERDLLETEFFSAGVWATLGASQLGVASLRTRLSNILHDQIVTQLPRVLLNIETGIRECKESLSKLGSARSDIADQRRHLLRISSAFTSIVKASIDGNYSDPFFSSIRTPNKYLRRLRAVIQNTLMEFAEEMRIHGHAKVIVDQVPENADSRYVSRTQFTEEVKHAMRESRGRELPGCYNPLIVAELFKKQCQPWERLAFDLGGRTLQSVQTMIDAVFDYVADQETAKGIASVVVIPSMEKVKGELQCKIGEILHPHLSGHPITYNHYLTENVQRAHAARQMRDFEKRIVSYFGDDIADEESSYTFNMKSLLDALVSNTEPDMEMYSCTMAIDMMEAYYKVAIKTLVDDISVLAIEKCLVQKLPHLFSPEVICNLTDGEIHTMAAESEASIADRKRISEKLSVLQGGLTKLGKFKRRFISASLVNSLKGMRGGDHEGENSSVKEPSAAIDLSPPLVLSEKGSEDESALLEA